MVRKKILILLSDTGGGHRASAGALRDALVQQYGPDSISISILDIWTDHGSWPFNSFVTVYRFASENPWCWKMLYESSRSPMGRSLFLSSGYAVSGSSFKAVFEEMRPDLILSVHPLCQHVPLQSLAELTAKDGFSPPFATIVTDLGGAHPTWFHPRVDRLYVPSDAIVAAALRGGVPMTKIRQYGLPLRREFWTTPQRSKDEQRLDLGMNPRAHTCLLVGGGEGVGGLDELAVCIAEAFLQDDEAVNERIRKVTKGAESGKASNGPRHMQLIVVCGKNETTRQKVLTSLEALTQGAKSLSVIDRSQRYEGPGAVGVTKQRPRASSADEIRAPLSTALMQTVKDTTRALFGVDMSEMTSGQGDELTGGERRSWAPRKDAAGQGSLRRSLSEDCAKMRMVLERLDLNFEQGQMMPLGQRERIPAVASAPPILPNDTSRETDPLANASMNVYVYGFAGNMDELMAASDMIVTKAGPGTIAEATTRGLPILLSSYLPGQEEGNVTYVLDGKFGTYCTDYPLIGVIVREWLTNPVYAIKLKNMSVRSLRASNPTASLQIAADLGRFLDLDPCATE